MPIFWEFTNCDIGSLGDWYESAPSACELKIKDIALSKMLCGVENIANEHLCASVDEAGEARTVEELRKILQTLSASGLDARDLRPVARFAPAWSLGMLFVNWDLFSLGWRFKREQIVDLIVFVDRS